jgi:glucokinase
MLVLAGDIGGTKTQLSVATVHTEAGAPRVSFGRSQRYDSRAHAGFDEVVRDFLSALPAAERPRVAGLGIAGPVKDRRCRTTNLPWVVDARALEQSLGLAHVALANDFVALARGIPAVESAQLLTLHAGAKDPLGPCAILGAGTGLGEAILVPLPAGAAPVVLATEGGHTTFAARDELEAKVQHFLAARHGHVSWERVVCGEGLVNLVEALSAALELPIPERIGALLARDRPSAPPVITAAARAGEPLCSRALRLFCSLYGAEAGNLALKCLPTGGVFVAGGIAPKLLAELQDGRFVEAYLAKGRMRAVNEAFSVQVVLDEQVALRGAALLAAGALSLSVNDSVTDSSFPA